jgi:hypothetical protein
MLESSGDDDIWTVFTVQNGKPIIEVLKNAPQENSVSTAETNSTGIVTVSNSETGSFIYKLRPGNKNSSIFGRINGEETEIKISDKQILIGTNTFQNNHVIGCAVGIIVNKNGGIGMGAGLPPELQNIFST